MFYLHCIYERIIVWNTICTVWFGDPWFNWPYQFPFTIIVHFGTKLHVDYGTLSCIPRSYCYNNIIIVIIVIKTYERRIRPNIPQSKYIGIDSVKINAP